MCYPPPGPRCSNHANAEWLKAVAMLEKETDTNKRIRLQRKVDETFRAFTATPRGQNRLLREIASLGNEPESKDEIVKLSLQLRDGQLTRKNQITAFQAVKANKESSIKTLLNTSNKQEQAVGIAFHVLIELLPETIGDTAHIATDNLIDVADVKILCLPQKHQRYFGSYKTEEGGYISSADLPVDILDVFADFLEPTTITPNHTSHLRDWFVSQMKHQGVQFVAIVDIKTENIILDCIENVFTYYDVSFTQKKKLGGTSPYIHGDTDLLKEAVAGSPVEGCAVTVAVVKDQKHTYILETPNVDPHELSSQYFHFTERRTPEGVQFFEVRTRHQSTQYELFIRFSRKSLVIAKTDVTAVKKFLFDNMHTRDFNSNNE